MNFCMKLKVHNDCFARLTMVLEWRECEHEDMDQESLQDAPIVNVLHSSGFLKFFCTSPMRANVRLLEFMIN